jgi:hypothetical protein
VGLVAPSTSATSAASPPTTATPENIDAVAGADGGPCTVGGAGTGGGGSVGSAGAGSTTGAVPGIASIAMRVSSAFSAPGGVSVSTTGSPLGRRTVSEEVPSGTPKRHSGAPCKVTHPGRTPSLGISKFRARPGLNPAYPLRGRSSQGPITTAADTPAAGSVPRLRVVLPGVDRVCHDERAACRPGEALTYHAHLAPKQRRDVFRGPSVWQPHFDRLGAVSGAQP